MQCVCVRVQCISCYYSLYTHTARDGLRICCCAHTHTDTCLLADAHSEHVPTCDCDGGMGVTHVKGMHVRVSVCVLQLCLKCCVCLTHFLHTTSYFVLLYVNTHTHDLTHQCTALHNRLQVARIVLQRCCSIHTQIHTSTPHADGSI